jgi:hypothetical protein
VTVTQVFTHLGRTSGVTGAGGIDDVRIAGEDVATGGADEAGGTTDVAS